MEVNKKIPSAKTEILSIEEENEIKRQFERKQKQEEQKKTKFEEIKQLQERQSKLKEHDDESIINNFNSHFNK